MDDDALRKALEAEYFHLQKAIEEFDSRALTIKAWSITFSLGAIGGAFAEHSALVLLFASMSSVAIWFLEAIWKCFQSGYYRGADAIEVHFRGEKPITHPFQIGTEWYEHWRTGGSGMWTTTMLWAHVALPHAMIAILGLVLYVLSLLGIISV